MSISASPLRKLSSHAIQVEANSQSSPKATRPRAMLASLAAYALTAAASFALAARVLKLWHADLSVPLNDYRDALLHQLWTKSVIEHGWYLTNPSLGAPGALEMHDYPLAESLHFFALKLLGLAAPNFPAAFNLYFLLGFPLAALTCLFALRRFRVSTPSAIAASVLFSCLHYHFFRGEEHLFLASYYLVPLSVMVALWVYLGRLAFPFTNVASGQSQDERAAGQRRFWASAAVAMLQASAGVYYAFFACYLLVASGACAALVERRLRPLAFAGALAALTMFGGLANMAPNLLYRFQRGANPEVAQRNLNDAEIHSLKIGQMLLPVPQHRLKKWAGARQKYDALPLSEGEKQGCALGVIGSAGFLLLLGALALPRTVSAQGRLVHGLALLNISAVLLAVNGGFGTLIALLVSPQFRGYNRISIYLALFALFAAALAFDRVLAWAADAGRRRWPLYAALAGMVVLGVIDQAGRGRVPDYASLKARFTNDAEFVAAVEAQLAPGDMVFQLPYFPFPEHPPVLGVECYDLARPYLHSRQLRWSYGAMKGRDADLWQRDVQAQPTAELIEALAEKGFRGIYIDRRGYADRAAMLEAELASLLGAAPTVSGDEQMSFYRLGKSSR
ncbi:MAG TPA: hypothetical protein VMV10_14930 [Pirellulales bacterium]|nr:hypothetical protein [Pirellulales bacterium]